MREWRIFRDGVVDADMVRAPLGWRKVDGFVRPRFDPFVLTYKWCDFVFAVMASTGGFLYHLETKRRGRMGLYLKSVGRRGEVAGPLYEKRMRAHFERYKMKFLEGYSLPAPPTPELRAIYDSAARSEGAAGSPGRGFSGGEYHWREWPLDNVSYEGGGE